MPMIRKFLTPEREISHPGANLICPESNTPRFTVQSAVASANIPVPRREGDPISFPFFSLLREAEQLLRRKRG